jgi:hypothetical protein
MVTALRRGAVGRLPRTETADLVSQVIRGDVAVAARVPDGTGAAAAW